MPGITYYFMTHDSSTNTKYPWILIAAFIVVYVIEIYFLSKMDK